MSFGSGACTEPWQAAGVAAPGSRRATNGRLAGHGQERFQPRGTIRITAVPRATRAKAARPSHTLVVSPIPVEANAPPPTVVEGLLYKGPSQMISDGF